MALDELDGRILALLEANGRESATKLAAKVGLSRSAVQERVARLERDGIIQGYTIRRSGGGPPAGVAAYLFVRLEGPACPRVAPLVRELPEVLSVESLAGELDMPGQCCQFTKSEHERMQRPGRLAWKLPIIQHPFALFVE